jgi:hypothetical protein
VSHRRRLTIVRAVIVFGIAVLAAAFFARAARAESQVFTPVADARVSSTYPQTNYGTSTTLKVDASPVIRSYLRFNVQLPIGATVSSAVLELNTTTSSTSRGFVVDAVADNAWGETSVTYANAPAVGPELGSSGGWSSPGYKSAILPAAAITTGLNSFAAITSSTSSKTFGSREATASSPRLTVTYSSAAALPSAPTAPTGLLVPRSGALFGAWHKDPVAGGWTQQGILSFEASIGRKLGIDHHYYAWRDLPGASSQWDLDNGRTPMISLGGDTIFPGFDAVNSGSEDAYIHSLAQRLKSFTGLVFLRPWYEMNGDWFPWDGTHNNSAGSFDGPSKFVRAWKRMHDIFAQEGVTNVAWVWSPDAESVPAAAWNAWTSYYPGDTYVDWVGIDGYNWGTTQTWSSWQSLASIIAGLYGDYASVKPIMVAETSSCEQGGDKGQWIAAASSSIKSQFPSVKAFVWFDSNRNCDWRVDSSQSSLDAYRAMGADPYFNP